MEGGGPGGGGGALCLVGTESEQRLRPNFGWTESNRWEGGTEGGTEERGEHLAVILLPPHL